VNQCMNVAAVPWAIATDQPREEGREKVLASGPA
jgi:hypothetical protein